MTQVLILKPTIINGVWTEAPFILTRTKFGWADRPAQKQERKEADNGRNR